MQQFSFNPAGIFSLNTALKNLRILNQSVLFQLFKKECHLLSDKLESMEM